MLGTPPDRDGSLDELAALPTMAAGSAGAPASPAPRPSVASAASTPSLALDVRWLVRTYKESLHFEALLEKRYPFLEASLSFLEEAEVYDGTCL